MSVGSSRNIPHFLSAGSPQGLQRLMLTNNVKNGMEYRYFDIQFDGKKWVAWYFRTMELPQQPLATAVNNVSAAD